MNNTLLVNVDTQHDFMDIDGKLYVTDAESIKDNLKGFLEYIRSRNIPIIHTSDWHHENSKEISDNPDFITMFPPHCMANTNGAELIDEVKPDKYDLIFKWEDYLGDTNELTYLEKSVLNKEFFEIMIRKDLFDVFSGNKITKSIFAHLLEQGYRKAYVIGVAKNVCVNFAVLGLLAAGYHVTVVNNCCSDLSTVPPCDTFWVDMYPDRVEFINY